MNDRLTLLVASYQKDDRVIAFHAKMFLDRIDDYKDAYDGALVIDGKVKCKFKWSRRRPEFIPDRETENVLKDHPILLEARRKFHALDFDVLSLPAI
jgi:hypothetical protein